MQRRLKDVLEEISRPIEMDAERPSAAAVLYVLEAQGPACHGGNNVCAPYRRTRTSLARTYRVPWHTTGRDYVRTTRALTSSGGGCTPRRAAISAYSAALSSASPSGGPGVRDRVRVRGIEVGPGPQRAGAIEARRARRGRARPNLVAQLHLRECRL
eukprot:scaffold29717_cov57-Phaeocystis_antarctica.AAC.2